MKLYTFVVHYLQMCMKEYGCCPKFKRGDNSTYTSAKRGGHVPCKCAYMLNVYKSQLIISRQTGSRNLTGQKTLPMIWGIYMKLKRFLYTLNVYAHFSSHFYTPRKQSLGVYRNHPVRPCTL
jgi:hypothetical protein